MPREILPIFSYFKAAMNEGPDNPFIKMIKDEELEITTYHQTYNKAVHLAQYLLSIGIKKGNRIAIIGANSPEWIISYLAAVSMGGVVVPVDRLLPIYDIAYILKYSEVKCVIGDLRYIKDILDYEEEIHSITHHINLTPDKHYDDVPGFEEIMEMGIDMVDFEKPLLDDLASIIFTSGTTGFAKGVMLTHRNFISDIVWTREAIEITSDDVLYLILPLNHVFAFTVGFLGSVTSTAAVTIARSFRPNEIIEDIKETGVTLFIGVPLLFDKILAGIEKKIAEKDLFTRGFVKTSFIASKIMKKLFNADSGKTLFKSLREKAGLNKVRLFVSGGAPASVDTIEKYNLMGFFFIQGYGLTETSPVVSLNLGDLKRAGSIGPAIPNTDIKILNPNWAGIGEIAIKGDVVMKGYYKNKEATEEVMTPNGYLKTGDLGYMDQDGWVFIKGRCKNVIVTSGGKNVYPEELEFLVNKSHFVLEAIIRGIPDKLSSGETLEAIIVPDYDYFEDYCTHHHKELNDEFVLKMIKKEIYKINERVPVYKRIKDFQIREEEFEKTSTKKIKRYLYKWKPIEIEQVKEKNKKKKRKNNGG